MTIEFLRFIAPGRGAWHASAARRDVAQVRRSLEFKIRSRARLTPAEQYLARNLGRLENNLFAPSLKDTAHEFLTGLVHGMVRPIAMTSLCLVAYFGLAGVFLSNSQPAAADDIGRGDMQLAALNGDAQDSAPSEPSADQVRPVADETVDMPQLAIAIATNYDRASANEEALLKQLVKAPAPTESANLPIPETVPTLRTAAPATQLARVSEATESVTLRRHRNLVKFISGLIAAYRPTINDSSSIARHIVELSAEEDMDPIYVASVIAIESRFASDAQSHAGARGLMQLLPSTAREIAKTGDHRFRLDGHLSDPRTNIKLGIDYLKQLQEKFHGNRFLALAAYNWGPANIDRVNGHSARIPGSVRSYSNTVLERTVSWRRHFLRAIDTADDLQIARPANTQSAEG